MATRRHIILVRADDPDALATALRTVPILPPEVLGPWCWTVASTLTATGEGILLQLESLQKPYLLFTTFDGDGWTVSASDAAGKVKAITHEFHKDWRENSKPAMKSVQQLVQLFLRLAPESDSKALEDALSGRALSDAEMDSDLGDLPRLFKNLGAENIVDIPSDPPARKERAPLPTRVLTLMKGHEGRAQAEITGISLPVEHAADLAALALFCDPDSLLALVASGHDLPDIKLDIPCKISRKGNSVFVEADGGIGLKANVIERASKQLATYPGLEELTVVSGKGRGGKDIAWHRYVGTVTKGAWQIEQATPAVDSASLASALALIAERRATTPIPCVSAKEADAVVKRCAKSLYFTPGNLPTAHEASLVPAKDTRFFVLLETFRVRFTQTWDASAAQRAESSERKQWDQLGEKLKTMLDLHGESK